MSTLAHFQARASAADVSVAFAEIWAERKAAEAEARFAEEQARAALDIGSELKHWHRAAAQWDRVCTLARIDVQFVEWATAEGIAG